MLVVTPTRVNGKTICQVIIIHLNHFNFFSLQLNVDGEGTLTYAAGHTYIGEWRDGKRTGKVINLLLILLPFINVLIILKLREKWFLLRVKNMTEGGRMIWRMAWVCLLVVASLTMVTG